mmetsp:Transcript_32808/g.23724  ORF Transcript_32808/g.23724 Transcript_32808/m.23724 type:complete len:118 (+) Transcript_32808:863-1216(+)
MSYITGMLLLHCGPPEECFKMLCNILYKPIITDFYQFNQDSIFRTYKVFWQLIRENTPLLYNNIAVEGEIVSCSGFLYGWIMSLFTNTFDIDLVACLWDQIFFFGDKMILKIGVAIF